MRELTWKLNKTRMWFDELPRWNYEVTQVVEWHFPASGIQDGGLRCVAVEMLIPTGPTAMYGALGATFMPEQREDLLVQVFVSGDRGQPLDNTLAIKSETAHIGFPKEYVQGLLEGVRKSEYTQVLGTGRLSFCRAIHGEVGSSRKLFEMVSRAVICLLCLDAQSFSDQELLELLQSIKS